MVQAKLHKDAEGCAKELECGLYCPQSPPKSRIPRLGDKTVARKSMQQMQAEDMEGPPKPPAQKDHSGYEVPAPGAAALEAQRRSVAVVRLVHRLHHRRAGSKAGSHGGVQGGSRSQEALPAAYSRPQQPLRCMKGAICSQVELERDLERALMRVTSRPTVLATRSLLYSYSKCDVGLQLDMHGVCRL